MNKPPRTWPMLSVVFLLMLAPVAALADITPPPPDFIRDYPEVFGWAFCMVTLAVVALLGVKIHSDGENNKKMWEKIDALSSGHADLGCRVSRIEGRLQKSKE